MTDKNKSQSGGKNQSSGSKQKSINPNTGGRALNINLNDETTVRPDRSKKKK